MSDKVSLYFETREKVLFSFVKKNVLSFSISLSYCYISTFVTTRVPYPFIGAMAHSI